MKSLSLCSCLLLAAAWAPYAAHAEQFLLLDLTYEATAQNTSDSHFPAMPAAGIPTNWRSPVNYANGTAYVRFEVLSAPSATKTLYNICFENSVASCMGYPPPYSGKGVNNFSGAFSSFWNYSAVDWAKGISKIQLILKDEAGNKVQGNSQFYPYKMHVQITIVAPGSTYVPPDATGMTPTGGTGGSGGGAGGSGGRGGSGGATAGAGGAGAGGMGEAGRAMGTAGTPMASAGTGGSGGTAAPVKDAGSDDPIVTDASVAVDAASRDPVDEGAPPATGPKQLDPQPQQVDKRAPPPGNLEGGCAVGTGSGSVNAWILAAISCIALRMRRRRQG